MTLTKEELQWMMISSGRAYYHESFLRVRKRKRLRYVQVCLPMDIKYGHHEHWETYQSTDSGRTFQHSLILRCRKRRKYGTRGYWAAAKKTCANRWRVQ